MTLVSLTLPNDGEDIDAADVNSPLNDIAGVINGNIDNANIKTGAAIDGAKLATGTVDTLQIADGSVTNAKLDTSAGELGGAWTEDTSFTLSGVTLGTGSQEKYIRYKQSGKTVEGYIYIRLGTGGSFTGAAVTFNLPVAAASHYGTSRFSSIGTIAQHEAGVAIDPGSIIVDASTTQARFYAHSVSGSNIALSSVGTSVPFTWGVGDTLAGSFRYEAA